MILTLQEYQPLLVSRTQLPDAAGELLWREYDQRRGCLRVEFPSLATRQQWRLTSLGWVGSIPLTSDISLRLNPKLSLHNLFAMWRWVHDLYSVHWLDGLTTADSLDDFYAQLAQILAERVLHRARLGLHRAYVGWERPSSFVRGQIQWQHPPRPGDVALTCRYEAFTADIAENQILAYTLGVIARSGRCEGDGATAVSRAYRVLLGAAAPVLPDNGGWWERPYTWLTEDYRPLHALCRFFLEHTGPTHHSGEREMMPFLVNMAQLYERFVAAWLEAHLPAAWRVQVQERVQVGAVSGVQFDIDLVLYDEQNRPHMVLDTKYKAPEKAANPDFNQVVTYAKAKGCREAVLVYPVGLERPLDVWLDDLHVRSLTFALDDDLEMSGKRFLERLAFSC